jgi:hypothetical protein
MCRNFETKNSVKLSFKKKHVYQLTQSRIRAKIKREVGSEINNFGSTTLEAGRGGQVERSMGSAVLCQPRRGGGWQAGARDGQ